MVLKHNRQLNIRIGDEEYELLTEISQKMNVSMSESIRFMICEYSKNDGPEGTGPTQP